MLVEYGLLLVEKNLLAAATGTASPPIFSLRSASPQESQVKTYKPVFPGDLRSATGHFRRSCLPTMSIVKGQRMLFLFI
jgi:hypothetical protein